MARDLTIRFPSDEAAKQFAMWLCESGEQEYWNYMEYRTEKDPETPVVLFDYWNGVPDDQDVEFLHDWTILTNLVESDPD